MIAVRAALIALAVLAIAWFALAVRADRSLTRVSGLIGHTRTLSPAQAAAADRDLSHAATLNPDRTVDVLRAQVALRLGQPRQAMSYALRAVHAEPQNAADWIVLEITSFRVDPALNRLAQAQLRRLVPPVSSGA